MQVSLSFAYRSVAGLDDLSIPFDDSNIPKRSVFYFAT